MSSHHERITPQDMELTVDDLIADCMVNRNCQPLRDAFRRLERQLQQARAELKENGS
jgi:hypothetical protein